MAKITLEIPEGAFIAFDKIIKLTGKQFIETAQEIVEQNPYFSATEQIADSNVISMEEWEKV